MNKLKKRWMEFLGWTLYEASESGLQECYDYIRIHHLKNHRIMITTTYIAVKEL